MRIFDRICGYCRVSFQKDQKARVYDLLLHLHMDSFLAGEDEEAAFFHIRAGQREYLRAFAQQDKIPLSVGPIQGLPRVFLRYTGRYGIIIGAFLAVLMVVASSLFVWDVRVEGNDRLTQTEVRRQLREQGVDIGSFVPTLDLNGAANSFLINSEDVGWMSLYRRGNVIYAKILEKEPVQAEDTSPPKVGQAANLVAEEDAVILSFALVRGKPAVRVGQVVKKGDLLAGGVLEGYADTVFVQAAGAVYGRVTRKLSVFIPFEGTQSVTSPPQQVGYSVNIFGKSINFSKDTGNLPAEYDTIECEEQVTLFGRITLPLFVRRTYGVASTEETVRLTEAEATRAAHNRMRAELDRVLCDGTLLASQSEGRFTDQGYLLETTVTFSRNIARQVAFSVENGGGQ